MTLVDQTIKTHKILGCYYSIRVAILAFAVIAVACAVGCGTALRVSHQTAGSKKLENVPGVPFYPKRARCRQEVVWFEPIYTLSLDALVPDKDGTPQAHGRGAIVLSRSGFQSSDVTEFMKTINHQPTNEATVLQAWQKIAAYADPKVLSGNFESLAVGDRILVGRSASPVTYVDYADQYYVNAKLPWPVVPMLTLKLRMTVPCLRLPAKWKVRRSRP